MVWQVLNAMLLACAGINSAEALKSITALLKAGAVPDTWAPNGSSVRALWQLQPLFSIIPHSQLALGSQHCSVECLPHP